MTDRAVRLRPVLPDDEAWFCALAADARVTARVGDGATWSRARARARFAEGLTATAAAAPGGWWVAVAPPAARSDDPERCALAVAEPSGARELEVGVWVHPQRWGEGLGGEVVHRLVALPDLRASRLVALVDPANAPALDTARRAGFAVEGRRRGRHGNEVLRLVLTRPASS